MPNKQKKFGQLFLIPSSLDQEVLNEFLIAEQKKQLHNLSYFIVEKEKAARKMLKRMNLATKIQELTLYTLSLIHICRCRRYSLCRSRWSPYH